jgi:tRNA(Ile)-lysidine synthetase-like protein
MCLAEKVRLQGGPFAIAHCNFRLRGAESDADEALVRSWARSNGIPFHVKHFDTEAFASAEGISVEMAARRLRYHWFGQLCREHGYGAVAVAHNANDNAETLILNLLRGTGVKGLTGMKAEGFIPDPEYADIPLLRPLLGLTREEIAAFAQEHDVPWREDSTNALNDYKRNKIRNLVFPVFREINPSFVQVLNRDMERFTDELDAFGQEIGPKPAQTHEKSAFGQEIGPKPAQTEEFEVKEEEWDGTEPVKQPEGVLILDADKAGELVEGRWETGDWIRPLGAPGKKKMQDWFTDHHIPADEKPFVVLYKSARDPHHVLAVAGCCIDHSVRVTHTTRRILRISTKND